MSHRQTTDDTHRVEGFLSMCTILRLRVTIWTLFEDALVCHNCGTRVCSVSVSNKCATHFFERMQTESCLVKAPASHADESVTDE